MEAGPDALLTPVLMPTWRVWMTPDAGLGADDSDVAAVAVRLAAVAVRLAAVAVRLAAVALVPADRSACPI
jgi:hypothetical protein